MSAAYAQSPGQKAKKTTTANDAQSGAGPERKPAGTGFTLYRSGAAPIKAVTGDHDVRSFLRRLIMHGVSLEGADFDRLAGDLQDKDPRGMLDKEGRLDLSYLDLSGADLRRITARNVNFTAADLRSSWIDDADLYGATLTGCDLRGARARRTNFSYADMRGTDMRPDEHAPGVLPASIRVEAKEDEGSKKNRFLAGGAIFRRADLDGSTIESAIFRSADMEGASLKDAKVMETNFDDARMTNLDLSGSRFTGCSVVNETVQEAITAGAVLRNNSYARMSSFRDAVKSPARLIHMGQEERRQRSLMPMEMKRDYYGSLAVSAAVALALPAVMSSTDLAGKVAGQVVDMTGHIAGAAMSAIPVSASTAISDACTSAVAEVLQNSWAAESTMWLTLHGHHLLPMSPAITLGLAGLWVVKKAVEWAVEPIVRGILESSNEAADYLMNGKPLEALDCLYGFGSAAKRILSAIQSNRNGNGWKSYLAGEGSIAVIGEESTIRDILHGAGLLDRKGRMPNGKVIIMREDQPCWPEDPAPAHITLSPDGLGCTAMWCGRDGESVRTVNFGPDGKPLTAWIKNGKPYPASQDPEPFFREVSNPVKAFMDGVVRMVAPHDGITHLARAGLDGSVIVIRKADRKIDNPHGPAAVASDGSAKYFANGHPVEAPTPEQRNHASFH